MKKKISRPGGGLWTAHWLHSPGRGTVPVPLLLIIVSIENIFAAGAAVLAGWQLAILVCLFSVKSMKATASRNMGVQQGERN